jgi:hypothetical protein
VKSDQGFAGLARSTPNCTEQAGEVVNPPLAGDQSVGDGNHSHRSKLNLLARWRQPEQFTIVGGGVSCEDRRSRRIDDDRFRAELDVGKDAKPLAVRFFDRGPSVQRREQRTLHDAIRRVQCGECLGIVIVHRFQIERRHSLEVGAAHRVLQQSGPVYSLRILRI